MLVEAHEAARPPAAPHQPQPAASLCLGNTARAKASAAGLLGEDSGNYYLYAALGWVLSLAGQHKVGISAVSLLPMSICLHLQACEGLHIAFAIFFFGGAITSLLTRNCNGRLGKLESDLSVLILRSK